MPLSDATRPAWGEEAPAMPDSPAYGPSPVRGLVSEAVQSRIINAYMDYLMADQPQVPRPWQREAALAADAIARLDARRWLAVLDDLGLAIVEKGAADG